MACLFCVGNCNCGTAPVQLLCSPTCDAPYALSCESQSRWAVRVGAGAGGGVFVRYFATWETGRLREVEVTSFDAGLAAKHHTAKCRRGAHAAFARALDEAATYMQVLSRAAQRAVSGWLSKANHAACPSGSCRADLLAGFLGREQVRVSHTAKLSAMLCFWCVAAVAAWVEAAS